MPLVFCLSRASLLFLFSISFQVLFFLRKYLGQYVRNIPEEALQISVWQGRFFFVFLSDSSFGFKRVKIFYHFVMWNIIGNVVLKDLELKAEALNELKLPVSVKAGFLGSVTLNVMNF